MEIWQPSCCNLQYLFPNQTKTFIFICCGFKCWMLRYTFCHFFLVDRFNWLFFLWEVSPKWPCIYLNCTRSSWRKCSKGTKMIMMLIKRKDKVHAASYPWTNTVCPSSSDPFYVVSYCITWVTTSWTHSTVCPGSSDPFYAVSYCIKWVTTSWTHSMKYLSSWKNVYIMELFWSIPFQLPP